MKKVVIFVAFVMALTMMVSTGAFAQTNDVYWVNYFSNHDNKGWADATLRIINPGEQGTPLSPGEGAVCADIYVFNNDQEMVECCRCPITADGIIELSVDGALTHNPLTSVAPSLGVIKLVSDGACNEQSPVPAPDLRAYATHVQQYIADDFGITEDEFLAAPLTTGELGFLGQACSFVQYLGSGKGLCTCSAETLPPG